MAENREVFISGHEHCKSLDRSITENKEKKSDAVIDESAQVERQRGREAEH